MCDVMRSHLPCIEHVLEEEWEWDFRNGIRTLQEVVHCDCHKAKDELGPVELFRGLVVVGFFFRTWVA